MYPQQQLFESVLAPQEAAGERPSQQEQEE